jgi:gamma-F420-2:alpha-L-glutamate ligase
MTKCGWLIYNREDAPNNQAYINWMLEEAALANLQLELFYYDDFQIGHKHSALYIEYQGKQVCTPDFAIVRTIDPFFTKHLEYMGTHCFNSSFVAEICNDKGKTHQYVSQFDIPMSDTLYAHKLPKNPYDYPYIVKEVHGRGGKQVYLIERESDLANLPATKGKWIIQKPAVFGKDLRVFVIGRKIFRAVLRESATDFKANYTLGGTASLYSLSENEKQLVEEVIAAFDFGMVGIDFLFAEDGTLLLNEIEDVVGSRTLSALSDDNIVREYLQFIKNKLDGEQARQ